VGSEMCIRDRSTGGERAILAVVDHQDELNRVGQPAKDLAIGVDDSPDVIRLVADREDDRDEFVFCFHSPERVTTLRRQSGSARSSHGRCKSSTSPRRYAGVDRLAHDLTP